VISIEQDLFDIEGRNMGPKYNFFLIGTLILFLFLISNHAGAQTAPDPKVIEGAKKDGQLVFYTTMTLDQSIR
jgi:hypothetical protein